ncbi:hypothetical protein NX905_29855, partial [Burkholderia thailandensis]|nr:hypothetical protein [Burkholderia thailandensis]
MLGRERERWLGCRRFRWGTGQPLGNSAQIAAHRTGSVIALFSPASSKARQLERKAEDVLLWNAWIDAGGQVRQLPLHTFITSRATLPSGRPREQCHALLCASPTGLRLGTRLGVYPQHPRMVGTGNAPRASQGPGGVECDVSGWRST